MVWSDSLLGKSVLKVRTTHYKNIENTVLSFVQLESLF